MSTCTRGGTVESRKHRTIASNYGIVWEIDYLTILIIFVRIAIVVYIKKIARKYATPWHTLLFMICLLPWAWQNFLKRWTSSQKLRLRISCDPEESESKTLHLYCMPNTRAWKSTGRYIIIFPRIHRITSCWITTVTTWLYKTTNGNLRIMRYMPNYGSNETAMLTIPYKQCRQACKTILTAL